MTEQSKSEESKVSNPHVAEAIAQMKAMKGLSKEERAKRQAVILGELHAKVVGKKEQEVKAQNNQPSSIETLIPELEKQYEWQFAALKKTGLIYELKPGEFGFKDITGKERVFPTFEQVKARLESKMEVLKEKIPQGFTHLQITPFGAPLSQLTEKVSALILKKHQEGKLKATDGTDLQLDNNQPLWVWGEAESKQGKTEGYPNADIDGRLVYYPKQYDKDNHGGKTKSELLNTDELLDGFTILLHEGINDLPAENAGQEVGGRKQFGAKRKSIDYLKALQTEKQYAHESGLTPEDWLTLFATTLENENVVIDDWQGQGRVNWNLAGYFKGSSVVSIAFWFRLDYQAHLSGDDQDNSNQDRGFRPAAKL